MRNKIIELSNRITASHEKIFKYLSKKSKNSLWFTLLLIFVAIYEVVEHFIIPFVLLWLGLR